MRDALQAIDLNLLYTFFLVVDSGGVGRAARVLGRTQPAVTARIQQLEEVLGAPLLERQGRGVAPTRLGLALMDDLRAMVGHARQVLDLARDRAVTSRETFRVGALPMVGVHLVAPALAALGAEHPPGSGGHDLDFEVRPGLVDELLEGLRRHELDVAVSVGALAIQSVTTEVLGHIGAVAISRDALDEVVTPQVLAQRGLISYPPNVGDPFFLAVEDFLRANDLTRYIRYRVPHIQTMKALVRAGAGVAIVPDYTAGDPDLDERTVEGLDLWIPLVAWTRPGAKRVALVKRFLERVRSLSAKAR